MVHYNMGLLEIGLSEKELSESIFFRDPESSMNRNDLADANKHGNRRASGKNRKCRDGYEGIKRTFLRSLGAKLLFGNSAKINVPRSWLGKRLHSFIRNTSQNILRSEK